MLLKRMKINYIIINDYNTKASERLLRESTEAFLCYKKYVADTGLKPVILLLYQASSLESVQLSRALLY